MFFMASLVHINLFYSRLLILGSQIKEREVKDLVLKYVGTTEVVGKQERFDQRKLAFTRLGM
ncbi:MAG TPA: hypothetical protein VHS59_01065, partial [Bacillota bacterium]|nr:hypothetical protein [Bacillota bacterium]